MKNCKFLGIMKIKALLLSLIFLLSFNLLAETPGFPTSDACYNYISEEGLGVPLSSNILNDSCQTDRQVWGREVIDYYGCVFRPEFVGGSWYPVLMMRTISTRRIFSVSGSVDDMFRCSSTPYEYQLQTFYYNGYGPVGVRSETITRSPIVGVYPANIGRIYGIKTYWKDTSVTTSVTTTAGTQSQTTVVSGTAGVVSWDFE